MGGGGEGLCRHVCKLVCYIDENMYVIMHMHKHDSVVSPYLPYKESGRETCSQAARHILALLGGEGLWMWVE